MSGKIIIYDHTHFGGAARELTNDVARLFDLGFDNRVASMKVMDSLWVGYEHDNYTGRQYILEEGDHPTVDTWIMDKMSSLKRLNLDSPGETPQITLYEHPDFQGRALSFTHGVVGLNWYNYDNVVSALKVKTGVWVLYEHFDYTGAMYVVTEGNYPQPENWRGVHDNISSLRPALYPDIPTEVLSMNFNIGSALLNTTPTSLVNLFQRNDSSIDQTASWGTSRTFSTTRTFEWHWNNSTAIGVSTTFSTGVPLIAEGKVTMGMTNTFSIGQGQGEENTQSDEWSMNLPALVSARTTLRVKILIQQGKIDVPFTAVLRRGNRRWEERGTFKGTQSYNLEVEYKETAL